MPVSQPSFPFCRHLRQDANSRAHIFGALRVVRRARVQRIWPMSLALRSKSMQFAWRHARNVRRTAHFVERNQAVEDIEQGVLETLRHDRSGELLPTHDKIQPRLALLRKNPRTSLQ